MTNNSLYPTRSLPELLNSLPPWEADPFLNAVNHAYHMPGMIAEFDRLTGCNLARKRTPLEQMIDAATGRVDYELRAFCEFVLDSIWERLPPTARRPPAANEGRA